MPTIAEMLAQEGEQEERSAIAEMVEEEEKRRLKEAMGKLFGPQQWLNEAASNFVPDAFQAYEETVDLASHPVETARMTGELAGGFMEKGGRKFDEFVTGEEIPPTPGREDTADAVIANVKENFGTLEAAAETIKEHPFDAAMVLHGGGLAGGVRPIKKAVDTTKRTAGAASNRLYRADMNIPKSMGPEGLELARFGAREGIYGTPRGLAKTKRNIAALDEQLNDLVAAADLKVMPISAVTEKLEQLRRSYVNDFNSREALAKIDNKLDELWHRYGRVEGGRLDPEYGQRPGLTGPEMHDLKRTAYQKAYRKAAQGKRGTPTEEINRFGGRGAKEQLDLKIPGYREVNKQWGQYAELRPYIEARVNQKADWGSIPKTVRNVFKALTPSGSKAAVMLRKVADADLSKLLKYTPSQVRYMAQKAGVDGAAQALWLSGQYDKLLEDSK
jgi:hypothetical protein